MWRSSTNRNLFGVCGGISEMTGVDVTLIRLGLVLGVFLSGSLLLWVYLILGVVLPLKD